MGEEVVEPEVTPVEPEVEKVEEKKEAKVKPMNPNRPLTGQVDKLLNQLGDEDVKPDEVKPEAEPKEGEGEPKTPEVVEPTPPPEVTPEPEPDTPDEPEVELPPVAKYILENLPEIQTIGHTIDGKDKVYTVKRLEELPEDFEFASKRAEIAAMAAQSSQELNARQLLQDYQRQEQQAEYRKLQDLEAVEVQSDITSLQREGILPKFQYEPEDVKFNDDPAVKEANAIYDLFQKTNQAYMTAKKTYRISYRDAADKYYLAKSKAEAKKTPPTPERTKAAEKVGAPSGASPSTRKGPLPSGTRPDQIYQLFKQGRI